MQIPLPMIIVCYTLFHVRLVWRLSEFAFLCGCFGSRTFLFYYFYILRRKKLCLTKLAKKLKCPVALTYRAKGFIDESEELVCGVIGRSGTPVASNMLAKADVVIAFGVGFSRHSAINTSADVIQIDNRQEALGRLYNASVQVLCDCSIAVKEIDEIVDAQQF